MSAPTLDPTAGPAPDSGSTAPSGPSGPTPLRRPPPRWRAGPPLLAFAAGWLALVSWSPMVAEPRRFLVPTFVIGLVVVLAGIGLRRVRVAAYAVAAVQLVVALLGINLVVAQGSSLLGLLPTPTSVRSALTTILNGAATLNSYASPVEINPRSTQAMLLVCALGVLLSIDLIAMWAKRLPLVALPLLVTLSVPVSILIEPLVLPLFVAVVLLYLRLLASDEMDRIRDRRRAARESGAAGGIPPEHRGGAPVAPSPTGGMSGRLWQVAGGAVVVALVVAPLVPVANLLKNGSEPGPGGGSAGSYELTVVNPFVRLRRDLVEMTNTPLVYARTDAPRTSYLRTTVLDEFTASEWRPSPRDLPAGNTADGLFPEAPGLGSGVDGTSDRWDLELAPNFATTWLPTPYPLRSLSVAGGWRYDDRTLDVAFVGAGAPAGLSYSAVGFDPALTSDLLGSTVSPPAKIRKANTGVPKDLPPVIAQRAEELTRGLETNYERAVAIQDWFREGGGFRYSTAQRGGSGMQLLADFVTSDRVGYCEQFASAMAAMGRSLGIPSRVVVGFLDGEKQADGRVLYTSDDRHAWPEMYFTGVGWVRFEPTPAQRAGATPPWTQQEQGADQPSAAPTPGASQAPAPGQDPAAADATNGAGGGPATPWWTVVSVLVLLAVGITPAALRRAQRRHRLAGDDGVELAEGAWAELRASTVDLGLAWPESRSPREQARSVLDQVDASPEDVAALEGLRDRVERGRYGGSTLTLDPDERTRTVGAVTAWRRVLRSSVDRSRGWRGTVWPVSLVRRPPR